MRLLARHPAVTLTAAMSSGATSTPRPLPALARIWDGAVMPLDIDRLVASTRTSSSWRCPRRRRPNWRRSCSSAACASSISLARSESATHADRQRWYPATPSLPAGTVYGLPERDAGGDPRMRASSRVPAAIRRRRCSRSNRCRTPACIEGPVIVDAKSGISGAGKAPSDRTHFSENHGSVAAYGVFSHRHNAGDRAGAEARA